MLMEVDNVDGKFVEVDVFSYFRKIPDQSL
jgi:hypothetical protein